MFHLISFLSQCLNILVQHGTAADYMESNKNNTGRTKTALKTTKNHKKISSSAHNTLMSKSSTGSSDTEPFYLHPPSVRQSQENIYNQSSPQSSPPDMFGVPNDGLYINPMRNGVLTTPSPNGSESSESFYLHNPQEVIYNRVKDIFDSDSGGSNQESSRGASSLNASNGGNQNGSLHQPNALTVQVEVHSSSSGAGSGSEESLSVSSRSDEVIKVTSRNQIGIGNGSANGNISNANSNGPDDCIIEQHDYEDIYLVREEARIASKSRCGTGRSRSRDSGSHSRSASASSNHSADIIVHYGTNVRQTTHSFFKRKINL